MFNRLPKPRYRFDPFGKTGSEKETDNGFKFKRKKLSSKKPTGSMIRLILMLAAVIWLIYYLGGFEGTN